MTHASYAPSEERLALADSAARLARERYETNQARPFEATLWRDFAELGWLAAPLQEANGGLALPWSTVSAVVETLAPAVPAEPLSAQWAEVAYVLDAARPAARRDQALAAWRAGERLLALAHAEHYATPWHTATLDTRCRRVADGHVINGHKTRVLDAGIAHSLLVSATDDDGQKALFIIDASRPGLRLTARDSIDGRAHRDVTLEDVRVDADARLGFARDVASVLADSAWLHALLLSAEAVGVLRAMLKCSHEYLVQRRQFGRPLIEMQVLQHRLVDMLLTLTRLESLLDVARSRCDELGPGQAAPFIAATKAACGDEGRALARQAVQLHGAIGLTAELALGRQLRRLTALDRLGGTSAEHACYWAADRGAVDGAT